MGKLKACSHPKGFGIGGKCPNCGKRKAGRPRSSSASAAPAVRPPVAVSAPIAPVVAPQVTTETTADFLAAMADNTERAARIGRLFPTPSQPVEITSPDTTVVEVPPEPTRKKSTTTIKNFDWLAARAVNLVDQGAGAVISKYTDLDPNDAGEAEREEFEKTASEWASQTFGKVEAPTWLVLIILLALMVATKIIGAPKKPAILLREQQDEEIAKRAKAAAAAASLAPVSVNDAGKTEPASTHNAEPIPARVAAGSAQSVPGGF